MATFRVKHEGCGDLSLFAEQVTPIDNQITNEKSYRFDCTHCGAMVIKKCNIDTVFINILTALPNLVVVTESPEKLEREQKPKDPITVQEVESLEALIVANENLVQLFEQK